MQLFVSNHLIPEDYEFKTIPEPAFTSEEDGIKIATGTEVRVRVVGARMDATNIVRSCASLLHTSCFLMYVLLFVVFVV